jgi:hypothetical protein
MEVNITRKDNTIDNEEDKDNYHLSSIDSGGEKSGPAREGTYGDIGRWNNQVDGPINHQVFRGKVKKTSKERQVDK